MMIAYGRLLDKKQFNVTSVIYYGVLTVYFLGVKVLLHWPASWGLPDLLRYVLGAILFIATSLLAARVDFLWVNYKIHRSLFGNHELGSPCARGVFYLRTIAYYLFLIGVGILLFSVRDELYFLIFYYLVFVYGSIVMAKFDYLIPSYKRYQSLFQNGRWGMVGKMKAISS